MADTVKVTLDVGRMYREPGQREAKTYGPGKDVEIPLDMARGLVNAGELEPEVLPADEAAGIIGARRLAAANQLITARPALANQSAAKVTDEGAKVTDEGAKAKAKK